MMEQENKKMGKFKRSLTVTRETWALFKRNKYLIWYPLGSLITSLALLGAYMIGMFYGMFDGDLEKVKMFFDEDNPASDNSSQVILISALGLAFLTTAISVFFQAGNISSTYSELYGERSSFKYGMKDAFKKAGPLVYWTVLTTTVGLVLRALQEKLGFLGRIFAFLGSIVWSVISIFVIPVLMLENLSVTDSVKRSTSLFKQTWGENIILNFAFNFIFGLILLFEMLALIGLVAVGIIYEIGISQIISIGILMVVIILATSFIQQTLTSIFKVVLYVYAKTGSVPKGFTEEIVKTSIKRK